MTAAVLDCWREQLQLERVSGVLSATDAADIRWYFQSGGLDQFSVSSMAGMLARAELFAFTARPCERCGGSIAKWIAGSGFECSKTIGRAPTDYEAALLKILEIDLDGLLPPAGDKVCRDCDGRGWTLAQRYRHSNAPLTARPTGSSIKSGIGGSIDLDGADLVRLGAVTSRIAAARAIHSQAQDVLRAFYAPNAVLQFDSSGKEKAVRIDGTLLALWHMVPAGKTLLRQNGLKLPPAAFFANERSRQTDAPTAKRDSQFKSCDAQAAELLSDVCRAWNTARAECRRKPHAVGE